MSKKMGLFRTWREITNTNISMKDLREVCNKYRVALRGKKSSNGKAVVEVLASTPTYEAILRDLNNLRK